MRVLVIALLSVGLLGGTGGMLLIDSEADAGCGPRFEADLSGDNEVPNAVETDTDGRFRIQFNNDLTEAEFRLKINDGERITQAHLHFGAEGENGPVIAFLAGFHDLGWDIDGTWVRNVTITDENIVNTAAGETLAEIADQMELGNVYVNVHSVANPGGEIRGQVEED